MKAKCGIAFRFGPRRSRRVLPVARLVQRGRSGSERWGSGPLMGQVRERDDCSFARCKRPYWEQELRGRVEITLVAYGSLLGTAAVGGRVMLSLADQTFSSGAIGFA